MSYWTFSSLRYLGCWKNTCPSTCRIYVRVRMNETFGSLQTCEDTQGIVANIFRHMCRYVQNGLDMCRYAQIAHHAAHGSGTLLKFWGGHLPIQYIWPIHSVDNHRVPWCCVPKMQDKNKSCFAHLKCNSCSKGTKFHSLSDTWSLQTLQILLKCRPNCLKLIPKLDSQGWTSSPQPNIQKSQWDASWKWIGLNWDFVQQGHRQSQIKHQDVAGSVFESSSEKML